MSGFDDNPFGEPTVDNPFADPAVQRVAKSAVNVQNTLEDYNPFEQENRPQSQPQPANAFVPVQPTNSAPPTTRNAPTYATNPPPISTAELQRRQEELDRKAAELDRREQQLQGNIPRLNNWPPLPEKCCFQPCFYQDINVDIPSEFQRVVRNLYYVWMFYTLTMIVNIIGGIIIVIQTHEFTTFGLSLMYAFLFTPASYLCWFRPAYKAFRSNSSFNFMVFFFVYFFQMVITIFQAIGIPSTGYCGFILALSFFGRSAADTFVGILLLIVALCFAVCAAGDVMMLTKIHAIYRGSGASFAKAQAEFASGIMGNQHVQQAAASAMTSAVNNQMNSRY